MLIRKAVLLDVVRADEALVWLMQRGGAAGICGVVVQSSVRDVRRTSGNTVDILVVQPL